MTDHNDREVFRAGVGIIVMDRKDGRVLALERRDAPGSWQLPQGGLEPGEAPEAAARRELFEETRLTEHHVRLANTLDLWIGYELPPKMRSAKTGRGQVHRWFLFELKPDTRLPRLPRSDDREFVAKRWVTLEELIAQAIAFRRPVYEFLRGWLIASGEAEDVLLDRSLNSPSAEPVPRA